MARLDPYVSAAEYRARTGSKATGSDTTLDTQLASVSRLLERELRLAPGAFNSYAATHVFDGLGFAQLYLRDRAGMGYFLQSVAEGGIRIDSDLDGQYDDYSLDFDGGVVRGLPENASGSGEPFANIEIRPVSGAPLTRFPNLPGCVQIEGTWGWAAVPGMIKELTAKLAHDLRVGQLAGPSGGAPDFDGPLAGRALSPETYWLWGEAKAQYSRWIPVGI